MRRVVLGTAGHIDHGKTLLTRVLTGVDTDRLAEEKARGITIELGFAPMRLSDGTEISLVDVPGHEKFVRTMMTGVSGVDGILLVVAADDGVMPQTREHFDILRLLNLQRGIVVLNKIDLVNEERIQSVQQQIRELVRGSFLEQAPVCPVSAVTGEGITQLKSSIEKLAQLCTARNCDRPFRLSVDRAFPVEGFGTVATGTLTEGTVHITEQAEILPSGIR
ncbi:MAG: selenocysteine-specific translation elongation factor, partial [Clostridia bacterium]|nr:selenocysteine-specific translation elongation factor [Clostridia bacterium]